MIELFHVEKRYEKAEVPALFDVTMHIEKGDFCLLLGPSGAGKTTLLRLLFGAENATRGQVRVQGKDLARLSQTQLSHLRRKIGVVFQDFKLLPNYTVAQNVGIALEVQGVATDQVRKRCDAWLEKVGLLHKAQQRADALSGGEQQRVAIARALVVDPVLLLCDEPTGNLDAERSKDIMELLVRANARGTTVMIATHDPSLIERYRKRVIHLDGGVVQSDR